MQGKQSLSSTERKGPHKSMHCKFCKPPGVVTPEKPTRAQLETKTKIHLAHEAADLRLCNTHDEPGFPAVESEACICILEGENQCPKCVPDKNKPPPKKKVCRCPKGAKPHPSMYNKEAPKKEKKVEEDEEFWWEKYSREHDALAKETWAAYMAQRRRDKKLEKCKRREMIATMAKKTKGAPNWYQKLSCQQMIYVEYLSTAIRLDSDENITDRTYFVLGGLGLYPRPKRKVLKRCLRYCHYNAIQFLNQLNILIKDDDPFQEKQGEQAKKQAGGVFTWNERLIMNSMCYLEFPTLLRELMDRLPPLPRKGTLPQIPYPAFPTLAKTKYENPYAEPIWQDRLNWVEKTKIDRLNRCRIHMETKRIKIPTLALVRRPSLIDARPPFLAQIEANERASRRLVKEKQKKPLRKYPISTFNSAVDVTAIAGIEASEISITDKADTDDICVFLREPKEPESTEGEIEEVDFPPEKEVKFLEDAKLEETQVCMNSFTESEHSEEGEGAEPADLPFKTPPKTESGATIASPCPPPDATPGPPATHYDKGKRELDIRNQDICEFFPFVSSSAQTVKEDAERRFDDVESNLKSAAEKLKELAREQGDEKAPKKKKKRPTKKCKKATSRRKSKKSKASKEGSVAEASQSLKENADDDDEEEEAEEEKDVGDFLKDTDFDEDMMQMSFKIEKARESAKRPSQRESEVSDPDPDSEDEWSTRPPCTAIGKSEQKEKPKGHRRTFQKRKGKHSKKKPRRKKVANGKHRVVELEEETGEYLKKKETPPATKTEETATESDDSKQKGKEAEKEEKRAEVFRGDVKPLVEDIIKDLAEEGFYCASYPLLDKHPDVCQLIMYLGGEIVTKRVRDKLLAVTKLRWSGLKQAKKSFVPELGVSSKRIEKADWNDKKWISRLAKQKKDQFFYNVANDRDLYGIQFYNTLYQSHFGTERYLKIFYAYMPSKYEDCILRGIF